MVWFSDGVVSITQNRNLQMLSCEPRLQSRTCGYTPHMCANAVDSKSLKQSHKDRNLHPKEMDRPMYASTNRATLDFAIFSSCGKIKDIIAHMMMSPYPSVSFSKQKTTLK